MILAGGSSERFGSDKRLAPFGPQSTLLYKSLEPYRECGLKVVVALSSRVSDSPVERALESEGVSCIRCERASEGMGSTLAEAVSRLELAGELLIGLGDMPLLRATTLRGIIERASADTIAYPVMDGRRGNPVLFGRSFLPELAAIRGERGAAGLIKEHARAGIAVAVDDPGIFLDADTPEKLRRLEERASLVSP